MHGAEGLVIAGVDRDNAVRVGVQFLDVHAGAEAAAFAADHDDAHFGLVAERGDLPGQRMPFPAVQGVDRRLLDDQFGDAGLDADMKRRLAVLAHAVPPSAAARARAVSTMAAIISATGGN